MRPGLCAVALLLAGCDRAPEPIPPPRASAARPAAAAPAAVSAAGGAAAALRLFDAGREPRALVAFAFDPARVEAARLELDSRMTRGGAAVQEERVTLRFAVRYPARDRVALIVRGADTTSPTISQIESTIGVRFVQVFHPSGETDMPRATWPPTAAPRAAGYVEGTMHQLASNLLPVVPAEPVGPGARWAHGDLRFELLSRTDEVVVIERKSGIHGPTRLDTGETVEIHEEQTHRMEVRQDGISRRVEALLVAEQPNGGTLTTRMTFDIAPDGKAAR